MPGQLSCKVLRVHNPLTLWFIVITLAIYCGICYFFIARYKQPLFDALMSHTAFGLFVVLGIIPLIVIPFLLSFTKSQFIFTNVEVVENRGYVFGLFKTPEIRLFWTGFIGWETDVASFRGTKTPYLELYLKNQKPIFISKRFARCWLNETEVKWETFEKHFKSLVNEINLPNEYSAPPQKHNKVMAPVWRAITFFILGIGVLTIIGVVAGILWALFKGIGILK